MDKGCGRGSRACHPHSLPQQSRWEGSKPGPGSSGNQAISPVSPDLWNLCWIPSGPLVLWEHSLDQGALLLRSQYQLGRALDPNQSLHVSLTLHNHGQPNAPDLSGQLELHLQFLRFPCQQPHCLGSRAT